MEFIPATATAVDKLERQAKTLSQTTGTPLRAAQAIVAQHNGYARWKHVTDCCTQTVALSGKKPLPAALQQVLDRAAERQPASVVSQGAFAHGFVFAMDVKRARDFPWQDYAECEDGWYLAAKDLWQMLAYRRDEETRTVLSEIQASDDLVRTALMTCRTTAFSAIQVQSLRPRRRPMSETRSCPSLRRPTSGSAESSSTSARAPMAKKDGLRCLAPTCVRPRRVPASNSLAICSMRTSGSCSAR